jgi:hypothetical protein
MIWPPLIMNLDKISHTDMITLKKMCIFKHSTILCREIICGNWRRWKIRGIFEREVVYLLWSVGELIIKL